MVTYFLLFCRSQVTVWLSMNFVGAVDYHEVRECTCYPVVFINMDDEGSLALFSMNRGSVFFFVSPDGRDGECSAQSV
jgi:hypothetical protein